MKVEEEQQYDPWLGLAVADTWWELGRWANKIRSAATEKGRLAIAREWADQANADDEPAPTYVVKPTELIEFVDTSVDLLERKFNGKPIAGKVNQLIAPMHGLRYKDDDGFLARVETSAAFWAIEYTFLFDDLERRDESTWTKAVGYCENEACGRFFIRQRIDNRFDSDRCRTNTANRKAYRRRARAHRSAK